MTLFVDTSAFYAAADIGDNDHERAKVILASGEPLMTTDHVLAETWLLLRHRLGRPAAERLWAAIRSGTARVDPVGAADLEVAWRVGQVFADQDLSIVDRTSLAVMERLGVHRVASFDHDFAVHRFGARQDRAFDVRR